MTSENVYASEAVEPTKAASARAVDDQLIDEPVGRGEGPGDRRLKRSFKGHPYGVRLLKDS
ncbi:hypothetical protein [Streptomyces peucetius]|uniref:Uncharacterized protein n=1 Tax=Streptomyces peucetius TaxID=1950 RepID=A0ABY6I0N8_STRPE|nr:hypothetical protein [Streptomyces peucetius]UYQ60543.1 hypothetical protein OGH68_03010 [Streptomyces peucetius]